MAALARARPQPDHQDSNSHHRLWLVRRHLKATATSIAASSPLHPCTNMDSSSSGRHCRGQDGRRCRRSLHSRRHPMLDLAVFWAKLGRTGRFRAVESVAAGCFGRRSSRRRTGAVTP